MRVPRRGADAWICSWDAPHNKLGAAQYLARLVSHAHQSAGPLQPASGCCSSSTPSPVLQSLGLPLSGAMGPCIHRSPDYMSMFTFLVTFSWGIASFWVGVTLGFLGGELHLKPWSRKQIHQDPCDYYRERFWGTFLAVEKLVYIQWKNFHNTVYTQFCLYPDLKQATLSNQHVTLATNSI